MPDADRWESIRKCPDCTNEGQTRYLWIKRVCKDEQDKWLHRLWCDLHGSQDNLTHWNGKLWSGDPPLPHTPTL